MPIGQWLSKVSSSDKPALYGLGKAHVIETGESIRQAGEGVITGALLGAAQAELTNGLDFHKVPLDLAVGAAGIVGALILANDGSVAKDLRNAGTAGLTIYAFRMTQQLLASSKTKKGVVKARVAGEFDIGADYDVGADVGADPIIEAAKAL